MEHRAGKGKFTVGERGTRVKRGPGNEHPELAAPTTLVDVWLAGAPSDQDEAAQGPLGVARTAAMIPPGGLLKGFEKEAEEIRKGIAKYGSLEEYEKHQFEDNDFFADAPEVPFMEQFRAANPNPTPTGNCFESHVGSAGIHRTTVNIKKKNPEFVVDKNTVKDLEEKHPDAVGTVARDPKKSDPASHINVPQPPSRITGVAVPIVVQASEVAVYKPSKKVKLGDDFDF